MAKRFTDTNKYKKPFVRGLSGPYKLLWDFLYHDCDHAGIWIVDFEITQAYIGSDMPINRAEALLLFNSEEVRVIEIDGGKKWFIPSFIEFQYGVLSEKNRAHVNVISVLKKHGLLKNDLSIKIEKVLTSPLQGAKEQEKEKEQEQEQETGKEGGTGETTPIVPAMVQQFTSEFPNYFADQAKDFPAVREIGEKIFKWQNLAGLVEDTSNTDLIKLRWGEIIIHIGAHQHYRDYDLTRINKHFQSIVQSFNNVANTTHRGINPGGNRKPGTSEARIQAARDY